jgi:hypothetical protein
MGNQFPIVTKLSHSPGFQLFPREIKRLSQICDNPHGFEQPLKALTSERMKKRKVLRRKADIQDLLLKASTLADNAITSAKNNDDQEAIQMLAAASHYQTSALNSLFSAIDKLTKAMQELED